MASPKVRKETAQRRILRIAGGRRTTPKDTLVLESPVTIFLNDVELVTLMCTPTHLDELATGFLFTEGIIKGRQDIKSVTADEEEGVVWMVTNGRRKSVRDLLSRRLITTGCGRGLSFHDSSEGKELNVHSRLKVTPGQLVALMKEFQRRSDLFRRTGGVHSAAVCDTTRVLVLREDIGRHSAVDKAIGHCVLNGLNTDDTILVSSGRISSEMVIKAARANIPMIASKSAPTHLGVSLAKEFGITVAGFVRGSRMNIYSNRSRVSEE
jgi:FdhD protein